MEFLRDSNILLYLSLGLATVLAVETFWLKPQRIRQKFLEATNFNVNAMHIGISNGIAIDLIQCLLAYSDGNKIKIYTSSDLVDAQDVWDLKLSDQGNVQEQNHRVLILTNDYQNPELTIPFWTKAQAQQCMISMRRLSQVEADYINTRRAQPHSSEVPVAESQAQPFSNAPPKIEGGTINSCEQDFSQLLSRYLDTNGFSRADGQSENKYLRVMDAITLLSKNYELICGCDRSRGWQKIVTHSLEPFFLPNSDDPKGFGYTHKTLANYVSKHST